MSYRVNREKETTDDAETVLPSASSNNSQHGFALEFQFSILATGPG